MPFLQYLLLALIPSMLAVIWLSYYEIAGKDV
jgi:hypothetical protein